MDKLRQTCSNICNHTPQWEYDLDDKIRIANELATLLLQSDVKNAINCVWILTTRKTITFMGCIVDHFKCLSYYFHYY